MQEALLTLGFAHTYHGFDTIDHPADMLRWEAAADAKYLGKGTPYGREEWDALLGHCAATTDAPCAIFWEELLDAYPEVRHRAQRRRKPTSRAGPSSPTSLAVHPRAC